MKRTFWGLLVIALLLASCTGQTKRNTHAADTIALTPCPRFSADSTMLYINEQCAFGPRVTGSDASRCCGDYLVERFRAFGAEVEEQTATVTIWDGTKLPARNIIASINPSNPDRIGIVARGQTTTPMKPITTRLSWPPTMVPAVWPSCLRYAVSCNNNPLRWALT